MTRDQIFIKLDKIADDWSIQRLSANVREKASTEKLAAMLKRMQRDAKVLSAPQGEAAMNITDKSLEVFLAYARDAGNWSGTPLIGGNVGGGKEERGNLTQLKRAGLITTFRYERCDWIEFTDAGKKLAAEHGIQI